MALTSFTLYGMTPEEWNVRDKLFQYNSIARLIMKDYYITVGCAERQRSRNYGIIRDLEKEVKRLRNEVKTFLHGDQATPKQLLRVQRELLLANSGRSAAEIISNLDQDVFLKRKLLDRLRFKKARRMNHLKELELSQHDRHGMKNFNKTVTEQAYRRQALLKKLEITKLQFEAAAAMKVIYGTLLDVMKTDSIYFNTVLESLRVDAQQQAECIYRMAIMGQLAREDFGNIKYLCDDMEKDMVKATVEREEAVRILEREVNHLIVIGRRLVGCSFEDVNEKLSDDVPIPSDELSSVEELIDLIQTLTHCTNFDELFPLFIRQTAQRMHLLTLLDGTNRACEQLAIERADLLDEARRCHLHFYNIGEEKEMIKKIEAERQRLKNVKESVSLRSKSIANIQYALETINDSLNYNLKFVEESSKSLAEVRGSKSSLATSTVPTFTDIMVLLGTVKQKVKLVVRKFQMDLSPRTVNAACAWSAVQTASRFGALEFHKGEEKPVFNIAEGFELKDPKVPTRADIKRKAKEIAEEFSKPPLVLKLKAIKFKARLGRSKRWL